MSDFKNLTIMYASKYIKHGSNYALHKVWAHLYHKSCFTRDHLTLNLDLRSYLLLSRTPHHTVNHRLYDNFITLIHTPLFATTSPLSWIFLLHKWVPYKKMSSDLCTVTDHHIVNKVLIHVFLPLERIFLSNTFLVHNPRLSIFLITP